MPHYKEVCEFGEIHAQCRCPSGHKHIENISEKEALRAALELRAPRVTVTTTMQNPATAPGGAS